MYPFVTKHGVILEKTTNSFENEGVFNPAAIREGQFVHLFYRAVREGNFSSIGYCKLNGPLEVVERRSTPIFSPENSEEFKGTEDPRITKIDNVYYLTYSAYDGVNVFGAYATSKDLQNFERQGIITPQFTYQKYAELMRCNLEKISDKHFLFYDLFDKFNLTNVMKTELYVWDKNLVFFPKKIDGKFAFLHRLYPSIQIVFFKDPAELNGAFWENYIYNLKDYIVLTPSYHYERSHIGAGCPPIETAEGWLLIYHAAQSTEDGLIYHAAAALLDLEDPRKVIAHLKKPLFEPTLPWEKNGVVGNVVFPSGTALFDDDLFIYYGAADSRTAVASVKLSALLEELKTN